MRFLSIILLFLSVTIFGCKNPMVGQQVLSGCFGEKCVSSNYPSSGLCISADVIANGWDISNALTLTGIRNNNDVSQCVVATCDVSITIFDSSLKKCSCLSLSCTTSDVTTNGWDLTGMSSFSGIKQCSNVSSCVVSACLSNDQFVDGTSKSCKNKVPVLSNSGPNIFEFKVGETITPIILTKDVEATSCDVAGLPSGLTILKTTSECTISGTVNGVQPTSAATVAVNNGGTLSNTITLNFRVRDDACNLSTYQITNSMKDIGGFYIVCTLPQLEAINNDLVSSYKLGRDITVNAPMLPIGNTADFMGNFNGNGYSIIGPQINAGSSNGGLFGSLGMGGIIENFRINNIIVNTTSSTAGAIVGTASTFSVIKNIIVAGDVRINSNHTGSSDGFLVGQTSSVTYLTNLILNEIPVLNSSGTVACATPNNANLIVENIMIPAGITNGNNCSYGVIGSIFPNLNYLTSLTIDLTYFDLSDPLLDGKAALKKVLVEVDQP
jgi:hypothetical protein